MTRRVGCGMGSLFSGVVDAAQQWGINRVTVVWKADPLGAGMLTAVALVFGAIIAEWIGRVVFAIPCLRSPSVSGPCMQVLGQDVEIEISVLPSGVFPVRVGQVVATIQAGGSAPREVTSNKVGWVFPWKRKIVAFKQVVPPEWAQHVNHGELCALTISSLDGGESTLAPASRICIPHVCANTR
jgi:hypothetical protein